MATANESNQQKSAGELADRLLSERLAIANFVSLVEELEANVQEREKQYGMPSSELSKAIEDGRITETNDVCNWLMDYELLTRATAFVR